MAAITAVTAIARLPLPTREIFGAGGFPLLPGENVLNARLEPVGSPFNWLSRDPAVVDAFIANTLIATLSGQEAPQRSRR